MGCLTAHDGYAIEALSEAYADLIEARTALSEARSATYSQDKQNPSSTLAIKPAAAMAMVERADKKFKVWLQTCGLTPTDRIKLQKNPIQTASNEFAGL